MLYRVSPKVYLPRDPTGAAATSEGRWHLMGQRVLYFSSSLSLCVLELKANAISFESIRKSRHYCAVDADPVKSGHAVAESFYSRDWTLNKRASQQYGADWYNRKSSLCLTVRSAVLSVEWNYLVNTTHPDFPALSFPAPFSIPLDPGLS